jgi:hypothetical protein
MRCYLATWLITLASAYAVAAISAKTAISHARLDPAAAPAPGVGHALALLAHNLPIAAWPILLGATGAHRYRKTSRAADVLVLTTLVVNAAPVGAALGAYGSELLPYLPHVPIEWAALALGASASAIQRQRAMTFIEGARIGVLVATLLAVAAALETWGVPHV